MSEFESSPQRWILISLELPDGRSIGFDPVDTRGAVADWCTGPHVTPRIRETNGAQSALPPPPSHRQRFTALRLADRRLAPIGGMTSRDMVALERKCEDCADEYIAAGTSTHVLDVESGVSTKGPTSAHPGDFAIRLRDGRIFKMGLEGETWTQVKRLDGGHVQLTQSIDAYPPRSRELIVELP